LGLGSNLSAPQFGSPRRVLEAALDLVQEAGIRVTRRSRWYSSAPEILAGDGDQGWYTNGVAVLVSSVAPLDILALLMDIESHMGRIRKAPNEARIIDLDLLAYGDRVEEGSGLALPHPRMHGRSFVLLPLAEVVPGWRHPKLGVTVEDLIASLPSAGLANPI
jgi:2-amino-4-hydroxy-6-hydroxymethyldihydropteridine diphosphokinase